MKSCSLLFLLGLLAIPGIAVAKDCWKLTDLKGQVAMSVENYDFQTDTEDGSIVLCFEGQGGFVTGEDTKFTKFGKSTLVSVGVHKGMEVVETYQIDRARGFVLFTQSRIGANVPGLPDIVAALKGKAIPLSREN